MMLFIAVRLLPTVLNIQEDALALNSLLLLIPYMYFPYEHTYQEET